MDRFKSILKTLGFWVVLIAVAVLGFSSIYTLTERGGLGSITGWVLAGITLLLLAFLFIMRRQSFRISVIILFAFWLIILLIRIATLHISENELGFGNIAAWLLFVTVVYFFGAWLILKRGILKVIGVLLVLTVSFAGGLVTTVPDYSRLVMVLNRVVWALMTGMGIFMVTRKGIGLRLLGVGLIIATMLTVFMAILSSSSPVAITGKDRMIILANAEPRINNLLQAWDDKDYPKYSKNFDDEMRKNQGQDKFVSTQDILGKLVSKDELQKLAPKSDSPSVAVEAKFIKVMYGATFEKSP
ncbi:MAG: hypothetical protein Q8L01_00845, partial [Candidatus Woesebacteria bacterium]|nr:hypothetical protein [Candidatus Woesebacteria bacterium]